MIKNRRLSLVAMFLMTLGWIQVTICQGAQTGGESDYTTLETKLVEMLSTKYTKLKSFSENKSSEKKPLLKLIAPRDGGRVFTKKDQTFVTLSMDALDNHSGIQTVCGARITDPNGIIFVEDIEPPYVLTFEHVPLGEQKFMVFGINKEGLYDSKVITLTVKKVNNFRIIPKGTTPSVN